MGHETGARAEQCDVRASLFHQAQLIGFNRLTQLIVTDFEVRHFRSKFWRVQVCNLRISPVFQSLGCCGVVTMAIDDQWFLLTHVISNG
jgi:hypothetical protein